MELMENARNIWKTITKVFEALAGIALLGMLVYLAYHLWFNPSFEDEFKDFKLPSISNRSVYSSFLSEDPDGEWTIPTKKEIPGYAVWEGGVGIIMNGTPVVEDVRVLFHIEKQGDEYYAEASEIQFPNMGLTCQPNALSTTFMDILKVLMGVSDSATAHYYYSDNLFDYDTVEITNLSTCKSYIEEYEALQEHGGSDPTFFQ